jgi:hypothetical protein
MNHIYKDRTFLYKDIKVVIDVEIITICNDFYHNKYLARVSPNQSIPVYQAQGNSIMNSLFNLQDVILHFGNNPKIDTLPENVEDLFKLSDT